MAVAVPAERLLMVFPEMIEPAESLTYMTIGFPAVLLTEMVLSKISCTPALI